MTDSWFSSEKRRKTLQASKFRRLLRVELFEQRMMLHGDALVGLNTMTDMDELSMSADLFAGSTSTSSAALSAEGEAIAEGESAWTHAIVADDAAAFFDDSFVHEVSITFENTDWYDVLFESHANDTADPYFAADVTIDGVTMENVGVRFKGNSSFTGTGIKKSLKIDFDEFDETNDSLTYLGLKKLNLNNNYNDPAMLREKLLYDFASNFVEGASRAVHTNVTINGELYGLYTAVEQVDKTYVQTRFGSDEDGNLFKGATADEENGDPNADFGSDLTYLGDDPVAYETNYQLKTNETVNDYSDLVEFIDVLNNTSAADLPAAIEPLLDVDDSLASLAINNLFANLDSYNGSAHNYYLYDRDDTGQFTHILWDANESFGRFSLFTTPGEDLQELDPFWLPVATTGGPGGGGPGGGGPGGGGPGGTVTEESRPLMENLWAVDEYSKDYLRDLAEMLRNGFDITSATARISELANVIRVDVTADPNKQYTTAQFEQNLTSDITSGMGTIYGLTSFIETRALYLDAELDTYASASDLRLNELMTVNVATVQDQSGDFDPWVEVYNFGPGLVDVSGLYLTDDVADLTKWSIPSENLDDGEFLTLWIDGETSEGTNHASFALSATGGTLQLTDGVTVIDTVTYAAMAGDTSLARVPDGDGDFETTDQPTFGVENLASVVVVDPVTPVVLYINEFMADNDSVVEDPDEAGAFEDWVEIYNPGTEAIDLSGMSMTDDLADPTQWQFASGTIIAAGGYLIVWADGDTDQGDNHATFKLSTGGEEIGLYHTDGTTLIDSVVFGAQVTDISSGRFPDGSDTFVSMTTPTPGATNVTTITNVAPTADAGGPYSGLIDGTIALTAAESTDSDGSIVSYAWDLNNDGQYDDATGVTASFTSTTTGVFTVGVQVTDDDGATGASSATVTVTSVAVTPVVLYINEFMADNDTTIEDSDGVGEFDDWIELYNPGTEVIDLGGMYLTDDLADPTQWQFTSGTIIAAGGYLIVWADGDTDQGDNHATFKLSTGGEAIGLYNTDGTTLIDSVVFDAQVTDISSGRFPDGSDTFVSMTTPTPGATNVTTIMNLAPTADAGGPYSGLVDGTITLTATGSTDSDGTIASFAWDLDNDGQYDDATGVTASFTSTTAGTFTVGVQVTDDDGATGASSATVTVTSVAVTPVVLYINEFMADNDTTIEDPDGAGEFDDWIELYNPGTEIIDLGGMYLTDDLADPTQWQFTSGTIIAAGGYLIVWADGDTDQGDNHATFKLSTGGEAIGLYNTDGTTLIDSVVFDAQVTDISSGRFPDGSDTFVSMTTPTPAATNVTSITNLAPTADAGGPYSGLVDGTITLTATGSTDSDGTIASFAWDLDNDDQYDDATGVTASFTSTTAGTFTVGVQVTDDDGATGVSAATIIVSTSPATSGLVVFQSAGSTSVNEYGTSDLVTVSLASQPTANVTVAVSSSDTGEVSLSTSSLTFTPGNWDVAQTFTVTGVSDGNVDGDQSVKVTLTVSSQDADYAAIANSDILVTNQDTDTTPEIPARIYTPNVVVRPHVITASSVRTAILFVAHASGTITITPIGTASVSETIRLVDGDVQQISEYVDGIAQATVNAGGTYAIIFEAQTSDRIYSVRSTAGTDAFRLTATTNFLLPTDTNGDSQTTPLDALLVINQLNQDSVAEGEFVANASLLDVNGDGWISPMDALLVINELNRRQDAESESMAEGESVSEDAIAASLHSDLSSSPVDGTIESETIILNEPEAEMLVAKFGSTTPDSGHNFMGNLVDDAVNDLFGDDADRNAKDTFSDLQLLADDVFDLSWV
ncbi:lamin tail domain-containing protein [Aureliella helgolandensis]|uniref:Inner spore coat protein H n=1 Tax=Aureliella helgolandensis TaxID=2527968 RepID=A0A518GB10_9BACT|nr:lamin tail domain-containing protein [Aureliella helgolandensis]QDV25774.1 Inner spore coat protein H [Aureliella helgolandensis]